MTADSKTLEELISEIHIVDPVLYAAQSELLSAFSAVRYKPEPTTEDIDRFLAAVKALNKITADSKLTA
jgi:hypothetical protein